MTVIAMFFPDINDGTYGLIGTDAIKGVTIERITPDLFLLNHRGRCMCVRESWIERAGIDRLDRKANAWRRYLRRQSRHATKVCWADKPGAFSGDAGGSGR
jgi:hypothetical protein